MNGNEVLDWDWECDGNGNDCREWEQQQSFPYTSSTDILCDNNGDDDLYNDALSQKLDPCCIFKQFQNMT